MPETAGYDHKLGGGMKCFLCIWNKSIYCTGDEGKEHNWKICLQNLILISYLICLGIRFSGGLG